MPIALARAPSARAPRVIIYARVSKDQQSGRSVSQQLKIGRRTAAEYGWTIVAEYADNDKSASRYASGTREDWPKVEASIAAGEADVLWVWEISRGTRDMVVWAQLAAVCRENEMYIALDDDVWDTTKPSHMKHLNTLMVDAVYESEKTASRINRDAADLAEAGHPWGYAGFGFRREYDPDTGDLVRQVPDPDQVQIIEEIVESLEAGVSPYQIAQELNRRKVPAPRGGVAGQVKTRKDGTEYVVAGWTHQVIQRLITRPAMMGKRVHHGRIQSAGGWDGVIDADRWAMLRSKLEPSKRRVGSVRYLLSGLVICDVCEARCYAAHRARSGRVAYRCQGAYDGAPRGHVQRVVHTLDEQVEELVVERFSDPDVIAQILAEEDDGGRAEADASIARLQAELDELYAEVASGAVSRRMAVADEMRIQRELEALEERARPVAGDPMLLALAEGDAAEVWSGWTMEQQREALRVATEQIRLLRTSARGRRRPSIEESVRVVWRGVG